MLKEIRLRLVDLGASEPEWNRAIEILSLLENEARAKRLRNSYVSAVQTGTVARSPEAARTGTLIISNLCKQKHTKIKEIEHCWNCGLQNKQHLKCYQQLFYPSFRNFQSFGNCKRPKSATDCESIRVKTHIENEESFGQKTAKQPLAQARDNEDRVQEGIFLTLLFP